MHPNMSWAINRTYRDGPGHAFDISEELRGAPPSRPLRANCRGYKANASLSRDLGVSTTSISENS